MFKYLSLNDIVTAHLRVMKYTNDMEQAGVLYPERLKSAILRPQAEYFGEELFPTLWDKVGALTQSLIQEHPFNNGNKRTAFACLWLFLNRNGYRLKMSNSDAEEMMVAFTTEDKFKGDDGAKEIGRFLERNSEAIQGVKPATLRNP
ncbi:type II toxin-antitoxin system death-on-curing family toxin [Kroppenstedtia pulmonis]|uniref:Type II toxin-antitoxin system death-on-curing family toxin n=1 Tax=Kroppenstedtia pulmonis TaxID=1380685 RepID=A0A7D3Y7M3_9BACL|nr:type II toxin-antitoxin system death-on-curing family toxin [Kroppenstedtia pulmonis]QKG83041.1 type II toxin-antitoxin system death-on-curing family toxin [Kroppenstedtia pulmonis]